MPFSAKTTIAALLLAVGIGLALPGSAAEEARVIPPPAVDAAASNAATQVAVIAGGCFWGVQGVFQHVEGVTSAVSGYAGGEKGTAQYDKVTSGRTGHAEAVRISYDPRRISLGRVLQIYFSVAHDPTELNHQGPDVGTQYRSAIFPANDEQARVAKAYVDQLNQARVFGGKVVRAPTPMHGKLSDIKHKGQSVFEDVPSPFHATRYHSLIVDRAGFPNDLEVTAETGDRLVMALAHRSLPVHGVQFHPESIASEHGHLILRNFLDLAAQWNAATGRRAPGAANSGRVNPGRVNPGKAH